MGGSESDYQSSAVQEQEKALVELEYGDFVACARASCDDGDLRRLSAHRQAVI
jgi:hypothetical protein